MPPSPKITNYLTIDVEEHFQVAAFEDIINPKEWGGHGSRVVNNTQRILGLLEKHAIKATFFVVGWTAERNPALVKESISKGHDIGCHSYMHRKIYDLTPEEFRQDTTQAKNILENITGRVSVSPVAALRAPQENFPRGKIS